MSDISSIKNNFFHDVSAKTEEALKADPSIVKQLKNLDAADLSENLCSVKNSKSAASPKVKTTAYGANVSNPSDELAKKINNSLKISVAQRASGEENGGSVGKVFEKFSKDFSKERKPLNLLNLSVSSNGADQAKISSLSKTVLPEPKSPSQE